MGLRPRRDRPVTPATYELSPVLEAMEEHRDRGGHGCRALQPRKRDTTRDEIDSVLAKLTETLVPSE